MLILLFLIVLKQYNISIFLLQYLRFLLNKLMDKNHDYDIYKQKNHYVLLRHKMIHTPSLAAAEANKNPYAFSTEFFTYIESVTPISKFVVPFI